MTPTDWRLQQLLRGRRDSAFRFADLRRLLLDLGFHERIQGSHHVFSLAGVPELLVLQPDRHQAKPYQVRQVRKLILRHRLGIDDGS
jgi:hypothetical protein